MTQWHPNSFFSAGDFAAVSPLRHCHTGWSAPSPSLRDATIDHRKPALCPLTSDGQKLTKKLPTNSLTNFFSYTNSLTKKISLVKPLV